MGLLMSDEVAGGPALGSTHTTASAVCYIGWHYPVAGITVTLALPGARRLSPASLL